MPPENGSIDFAGFDGTGAYVMKSFDPGVRAEMIKNPNYWRTDRGHVRQSGFTVRSPITGQRPAIKPGVDIEAFYR